MRGIAPILVFFFSIIITGLTSCAVIQKETIPLTGYLVHREGRSVVMDLGTSSGIRSGNLLLAFEVEEEINHPISQKTVRIRFRSTGTIQVEEVGECSSSGMIVSETDNVTRGQFLRVVSRGHAPNENWWEEAQIFEASLAKHASYVRSATSQKIETTHSMDGVESAMAYIPEGSFVMGDSFREGVYDEYPIHMVSLDAFYADVYEVTNTQYKVFLDANPRWSKALIQKEWHDGNYLAAWSGELPPSGKEQHPVVWISWYAADAYCEWLNKRLPTEAEWEKAARGGLEKAKYPRSNSISHNDANYAGLRQSDSWAETSPVGSFAPNSYGLHDVAGNVWEWCADWYDPGYYIHSRRQNPRGPVSGDLRTIRGGSFVTLAGDLRVSNRLALQPFRTNQDVGFRCVQDATTLRR